MFELQLVPAVLLRKAVAVLHCLGDVVLVNMSPEDDVIIAAVSRQRLGGLNLLALLRIPNSAFALLNCHGPSIFQLDLSVLLRHLSRAGNGGKGDNIIGFVTRNPEIECYGWSEMTEETANLNIRERFGWSDIPYQAMIGIRAEEFIDLIIHLQHFGKSVSVHATDTEVKFSALHENKVYKTELRECFIWGVQHAHPVSFNFTLRFLSVFLNACLLSNIVWFLYSENSHPTLNCAIG